MSFTGLAYNQTVSYGNLQDAVNNGIYTLISTIPSPSNRESTKSVVSSSVSGFNPNYPQYAAKLSNQLIVQGDIYQPGSFILDASYGMNFTSLSGSVGLPTFQPSNFSFPVTGGNTTKTYNGSIASQTITIGLNGTRFTTPLKVVLYVDNVQVDCKDITANGVQTKTLNLSISVGSPSTVKISINGSACSSTPTTPVFSGKPFSALSVNRGSGQYMVAGNSYLSGSGSFTAGYIYYSTNYGSTWTQTSKYGYWQNISSSDNGQYVLACEYFGSLYLSSNYGATFTQITSTGVSGVASYQSSALSNDGQYQMVTANNYDGVGDNCVYVSSNYGASFSGVYYGSTLSGFGGCAMDASGSNFLIGQVGGSSSYMYKSTDHGSTWSNVYYDAYGSNIADIKITASSGYAIASTFGTNSSNGYLIKSSDSGSTWSKITNGSAQQSWWRVAINNLVKALALYQNGRSGTSYIQQVTNAIPFPPLNTVSNLTTSGVYSWRSIGCSDNGTYILAGADSGLYLSSDGGSTFNAL